MTPGAAAARAVMAAVERGRWPDWRGQAAVVVAGGPSATGCDLTLVRGRARVVVVNNSVRLAPWADVLYAGDVAWWRVFGPAVAAFRGLKVAGEASETPEPGVRYIGSGGRHSHFVIEPGRINDFVNSGAGAIDLALGFGARRVALVGFDMHDRAGAHWDGEHGAPLDNPNTIAFASWVASLDAAAPSAAAAGAEIVNCSPDSALQAYPKMAWPAAVEWLLQ